MNVRPVPEPLELPSGFGLRWQAKRDTALEMVGTIKRATPAKSAVATALCRRSPKRFLVPVSIPRFNRRGLLR
jgi:hypothetical protein